MKTIGALSKETGCPIETIRYYEKAGLIPKPARSEGRHRLYGDSHIKRLQFVLRGRELGFGLNDIKALLTLAGDEKQSCQDVLDIAKIQLAAVRRKIESLSSLERELDLLAVGCQQCCPDANAPDCSIIEALSSVSASFSITPKKEKPCASC